MPRKTDDTPRIIAATMQRAAIGGWRGLTLHDIAVESGLGVQAVVAAVGSRTGVIAALAARADHAMLAAVDADWPDTGTRDRLFTLLMARLDVLKEHREGLRAVLTAMPMEPASALCLLAGPGQRALRLALEASGVSAAGPLGRLRLKALGLAYASVFRTFLDDDTDDLSKTMAALDRALKRLEGLAGRLRTPFGRRAAAAAASDTLGEASAGM